MENMALFAIVDEDDLGSGQFDFESFSGLRNEHALIFDQFDEFYPFLELGGSYLIRNLGIVFFPGEECHQDVTI